MVLALSNNEPLADDGRISGDAALMKAAARGNNNAWATIVADNLPIVHRTVFRLLRDDQLAEDIAQESFVRLWKLAESWQPRGRISTWLCHVARNLAIDAIRRRSREQTEEVDDDLAATGPSPLDSLASRETEAAIDRAIAELPERQRMAILLIHFGDCTGAGAAEIMGISVEALESLLARGRRSLKAVLSGNRGK